MRVLHVHERCEATAPAFPPVSAGTRPGARIDARGVRMAGDFTEIPYLACLMERAAMSGVLAADDVLAEVGSAGHEILGCRNVGCSPGSHHDESADGRGEGHVGPVTCTRPNACELRAWFTDELERRIPAALPLYRT